MLNYAKEKGYGDIQILIDVVSGLNESRRNFLKLLEMISCGLRMDRQLNATINLCLQVEGLTLSLKLFNGLMRGGANSP